MTDSNETDRAETYKGGFARILHLLDRGEWPYTDLHGILRPDIDFDAAEHRMVQDLPAPEGAKITDLSDKWRQLAPDFTGQSELLLWNALLIASLRRRDPPPAAAALFHRIWEEKGFILSQLMPTRWLISTVTTFADHGQTDVQRRVGQSLTVLFGMMKLYESERLYSGVPAAQEYLFGKRSHTALPMELSAYSIHKGDLDLHLLGRLWKDAETDVVFRPVCFALLHRLNQSDDTVFRRLRVMRAKRKKGT